MVDNIPFAIREEFNNTILGDDIFPKLSIAYNPYMLPDNEYGYYKNKETGDVYDIKVNRKSGCQNIYSIIDKNGETCDLTLIKETCVYIFGDCENWKYYTKPLPHIIQMAKDNINHPVYYNDK